MVDNKSFSNTLLLPKTSFPLRSEGAKREEIFRKKTSEDLYLWQKDNLPGPPFILHDGPPYANGNLHMGHAMNKILKDIINRFHVLQGRQVHYAPGWDCHGLPIETKALQELQRSAGELTSTEVRDACRKVALREIDRQREEFRQLGIMADWSDAGVYRSLDHDYEIRQLRVFQSMVQKGLISRRFRPVYWSPSSKSALAEAELVYEEKHRSRSVYVGFKLLRLPSEGPSEDSSPLSALYKLLPENRSEIEALVWTTTPWTLPANMGIAINNEVAYTVIVTDAGRNFLVAEPLLGTLREVVGPFRVLEYVVPGSSLNGIEYEPLFGATSLDRHFQIFSASFVTSAAGTGLVHTAPGHGYEDYQAFLQRGISEIFSPVDDEGRFSTEVTTLVPGDAGQSLVGQRVLKEGTTSVIQLLKDNGRMLAESRIVHIYPYDWRSKEPVIVRATRQWFANLDDIKSCAENVLQDIKFHPTNSRTRLSSYVRERSEWCISRQRAWGVPIPALYNISTDEALLDSDTLTHIIEVLEREGVQYWWTGPMEELVPPHLLSRVKEYRKGMDTMDVWFDSGTSWTLLRHLGLHSESGDQRLPAWADLALEGSDQHRGWFQSLLLTSIGTSVSEEVAIKPYHTAITHGFVLDEQGRKMSKSLGNILSPMSIIYGGDDKKKQPAYGSEVLRLWVATVDYWRDSAIGPAALVQVAESFRKIRNSVRFILGNLNDTISEVPPPVSEMNGLGLAERYLMHSLYHLEAGAMEGYRTYNFPKVTSAVTNFANITLSSLYFDIVKDTLYADHRESSQRTNVVFVLQHILYTFTRVVAPILPHLAEEIYLTVQGNPTLSLFSSGWSQLDKEWDDPALAKDMETLLAVRSGVLGLLERARTNKLIRSSLEAEVDLVIPGDSDSDSKLTSLLLSHENFLRTLFIVSDSFVLDEGSMGTQSPPWVLTENIPLKGTEWTLLCRVRPATQEKCPRCWTFTRPPDKVLCRRCEDVCGC